jgi:hypothetical protein
MWSLVVRLKPDLHFAIRPDQLTAAVSALIMSSAAQQIVFAPPELEYSSANSTPWTARSVILYITHQILNLQKQRGTDLPVRRVRRMETSVPRSMPASLSEHSE